MSVIVPRVGVNLPIVQRNRQINKLLTGTWLIVGMIIAAIEQVASRKRIPLVEHVCVNE